MSLFSAISQQSSELTLATSYDRAYLPTHGNVYQPDVENIRTRPCGATDNASKTLRHRETSPTTPAASRRFFRFCSGLRTAPEKTVDVTAILDALAAKNPEKLDWRKSIVDLMKLVDMDSSLSARKQLAKEFTILAKRTTPSR